MPSPSTPFFAPFGGRSERYPFWNRMGTCAYDHSLNLDQAKAAKFLPRISEDQVRQLPLVMYPGTLVGVLNTRDHTDLTAFTAEKPGILVPAHASAAGYEVVYTALDADHSRYGSVYDVDGTGASFVSGAGTSTATVAQTIPLGVVQEPVWCEATQLQFRNMRHQHKINVLSRGRQLRIPCMTAEEKLIFPGDLVQVSDTAGDHNPTSPITSYPGRWKKFDPTGTDVSMLPFVVGRCVDRRKIASGSATTMLSADLAAGTTLTSVNADQDYDTLARVQTVPGLGLQGSGTQGLLASQTFAVSDGSGDYWEIDVAIGVVGI